MLATLDVTATPRTGPGPLRVSGNPVQPDEAIAFFQRKSPLEKATWLSLSEDAKKRAFTAAWVTDVAVLQSVQSAINRAIAGGQSFESWKQTIRAELAERWSRSDGYLDTVFRNNVQSAYAAGRYQASTTPTILKLRPYWRLVVILDNDTSEYCKPLASPPVVLPADDPWWTGNYPQRHHRCRATVVTHTRRQAERIGVTSKAPATEAQDGWGSTAGLGEWQPSGDGFDPAIFKPAQKAAAKLT